MCRSNAVLFPSLWKQRDGEGDGAGMKMAHEDIGMHDRDLTTLNNLSK